MGKIIAIILIVILVSIPALILALLIITDIKMAVEYTKAQRCQGIIMKQLDDLKHTNYGGARFLGIRSPENYRRYRQYEVEYEVDGKIYSGTLQTREKDLQVGRSAEIRYTIDDKSGEPEITSVIYRDRVAYLGLSIVGAIILVAIFVMTGAVEF